MTLRPWLMAVLALSITLADAGRGRAGSLESGKAVFARCASCHSTRPGQNGVGPSLFGVIGRRAGTAPGFRYSSAMTAFGRVWDPGLVSAYLADPKTVVPGNKMTFPGLKSAQDRDNIAAYLSSLK